MKRPDRNKTGLLAALLVVLCATGCGGVNGSIPISPLMFLQNQPTQPAATVPTGPSLAVNSLPAVVE